MECPRCHGFMVIDACLNVEGFLNKAWVHEWRCLNCGEIIDAQTLANRNTSRQHFRSRRPQKVAQISQSR